MSSRKVYSPKLLPHRLWYSRNPVHPVSVTGNPDFEKPPYYSHSPAKTSLVLCSDVYDSRSKREAPNPISPHSRICKIPIGLFLAIIVIPFSSLVSFGFCAIVTVIGTKLWQALDNTTGIHSAPGTIPAVHPGPQGDLPNTFYRAVIIGCAIVDSGVCLTALVLSMLVHTIFKKHSQLVLWTTIGAGTLLASVFVGAVGIVVLPPNLDPTGVSVKQALDASALGTAVFTVPIGIVGLLVLWRGGC